MPEQEQEAQRFQVRDMSGPAWDGIPADWCVVDMVKEARVSVFADEWDANVACDELNAEEAS